MRTLTFLVVFLSAVCAFSQGTVNFNNCTTGVNAPMGANLAQLYIGPAGIVNSTLLTTNGVSGTPASIQPNGCFAGGVRTIEGFGPGTVVTLQVRVWNAANGSSWETAGPGNRGESNLIQVSLGGGGIPTPNMVGLQGNVPEPSSTTLAVLGFVAASVFGTRRHM